MRHSGSYPEWEGEMKNRGVEGRRVEDVDVHNEVIVVAAAKHGRVTQLRNHGSAALHFTVLRSMGEAVVVLGGWGRGDAGSTASRKFPEA